jgi:hypothetical protein
MPLVTIPDPAQVPSYMEHWSLLLVTTMLFSCGSGYDPSKVEVGMSAAQVVDKVGEPVAVLPMRPGLEFWRYEEDHALLMGNDTVVGVGTMTDEEYRRTLMELEKQSEPNGS